MWDEVALGPKAPRGLQNVHAGNLMEYMSDIAVKGGRSSHVIGDIAMIIMD